MLAKPADDVGWVLPREHEHTHGRHVERGGAGPLARRRPRSLRSALYSQFLALAVCEHAIVDSREQVVQLKVLVGLDTRISGQDGLVCQIC